MQNSEAVQAWIQGKMSTLRILVLVSKTQIRSREFSFLSRSLRIKIINLDLVSMPEIGRDLFSVSSWSLRLRVRNSRSRLDVRDWIREILIFVSRMKKWLSLTSDSNLDFSVGDGLCGGETNSLLFLISLYLSYKSLLSLILFADWCVVHPFTWV